MSIDIEKPAPLMVGDKAYYNLTSYGPVTVEVEVPYVTDMDVEMALAALLHEMGATPADLANTSWMAEHFDGITDQGVLRQQIRGQVEEMNAALAEEQKAGRCIEELSKRLRQAVPPAHVARAREGAQFAFEQQLAVQGLSVDQFLAQSGLRPADLSAMLDEQAKRMSEQDAALDAYAREKKLSVTEDEFGPLLSIPASEIDRVISQMKEAGQYEQMKEAALHAKAAQMVVAECSCTYRHETPEEARRRNRNMEAFQQQLRGGAQPTQAAQASPQPGDAGGNPTGLHLVP